MIYLLELKLTWHWSHNVRVCFCVLRRCCFVFLIYFVNTLVVNFFFKVVSGSNSSLCCSCGRLLDEQAHNGAVAEAGGEERQAVGGERHGLHSTAAVRVALQLDVLLLAVEEAAWKKTPRWGCRVWIFKRRSFYYHCRCFSDAHQAVPAHWGQPHVVRGQDQWGRAQRVTARFLVRRQPDHLFAGHALDVLEQRKNWWQV